MVVKAFSYIYIYISFTLLKYIFPIPFPVCFFVWGQGISHELDDELLLLCNLCLSIQKMYI